MVTDIDQYVIDKVRELRQEKGISQSQLAFELEISTSYIAMIESGNFDKKYNISHLNKIALVLQCSPKDFMPEEPFNK